MVDVDLSRLLQIQQFAAQVAAAVLLGKQLSPTLGRHAIEVLIAVFLAIAKPAFPRRFRVRLAPARLTLGVLAGQPFPPGALVVAGLHALILGRPLRAAEVALACAVGCARMTRDCSVVTTRASRRARLPTWHFLAPSEQLLSYIFYDKNGSGGGVEKDERRKRIGTSVFRSNC